MSSSASGPVRRLISSSSSLSRGSPAGAQGPLQSPGGGVFAVKDQLPLLRCGLRFGVVVERDDRADNGRVAQ